KKRDYPSAIADYDQSLKLNPNNSFAYFGRQRVQTLLTTKPPGPAAQVQLPPPQPATSAIPADAQARLPPQTSAPQPVTSAIPSERRVALVIGNSAYTSSLVSPLPNPRRDAKLVADALRQAGFETMELTDLDYPGMVKALQAFRAKADSADWALV